MNSLLVRLGRRGRVSAAASRWPAVGTALPRPGDRDSPALRRWVSRSPHRTDRVGGSRRDEHRRTGREVAGGIPGIDLVVHPLRQYSSLHSASKSLPMIRGALDVRRLQRVEESTVTSAKN